MLPSHHDSIIPGLKIEPSLFTDNFLIPDLGTFRVCPWNPKIGLVFPSIFKLDRTPNVNCPRGLLRKACQELRSQYGLELRVGVEIEFILLKKDGTKYEPIENGTYSTINALSLYEDDLLEINRQLKQAGIKVEQIHKEAGFSQLELCIRYDEVFRSLDNV